MQGYSSWSPSKGITEWGSPYAGLTAVKKSREEHCAGICSAHGLGLHGLKEAVLLAFVHDLLKGNKFLLLIK